MLDVGCDTGILATEFQNMNFEVNVIDISEDMINVAKDFKAEKIYICAGSSEDTIAFYFELGCVEATEVNEELYKMDRNDYQLEYRL